MSRKSPATPDMFAVLELQTRTSHFPLQDDYAGALTLWRETLERYNAAMIAGDTAEALIVAEDAELLVKHLHGASLGCANTRDRLSADSAAADGELPMWGQAGNFELEYKGIPIRIEVDGLGGIGSYSSLMPHFSIHIVEKHRLFPSSTGYRSFFSSISEAPKGAGLAFMIRMVLCEYVEHDLKGKLERYISPEEQAEISTRRRDEAIAQRARLDAGEVPEVDEDEDVDVDTCCCDCGLDLSKSDEYFATDCGEFCDACMAAHQLECAGCAAEVESLIGGAEDALLPGMGDVAADRAAALAEAEGEALTDALSMPLPSISKRTREMETRSPLFGESAANPQFSLFAEVA